MPGGIGAARELPERDRLGRGAVEFCVGVGRADDSPGGEGNVFGVGLSMAGLVPDRLRGSFDAFVVIVSGCVLLRSCAAEADGRNRRRGATDPSAVMSSLSFGGGAGGGDAESFCDGVSVDAVVALPLRCRSLYFSIASASRSRMRVAIGDRAEAGFGATWGKRVAELGCEMGDAVKPNVLLVELADG